MTHSCVPNKRGGWNTRDGDFLENLISVLYQVNVFIDFFLHTYLSFSMIQAHSILIFYKKFISMVVLISAGGNFPSKKKSSVPRLFGFLEST